MQEEKEKRKNTVTEWSFSFEELGDKAAEFFRSIGIKSEEHVRHEQFFAPLDGASSARVRLDLSVGQATITPLTSSENLCEADLTYVGEIQFEYVGETEKQLTISNTSEGADWFRSLFGWIGSGQKLRWDIALNDAVPLDLDIHNSVGKGDFNLGTLNVEALHLHGGVGEVTALLPGGAYSARIDAGVGKHNLSIPAGANVSLRMSAGTGEVNLRIGEGAAVEADIDGGVGSCNITVPADAGVRVEFKAGLGDISLPSEMRRISGDKSDWNKSGVWESPNYATTERPISIVFSGGVGGLKVRYGGRA